MCLLVFTEVNAQKKAVTENGEEVILYDNGTWKYLSEPVKIIPLETNPNPVTRPGNATFQLKSKKIPDISFWVDTKKWRFVKGELNADAEFELKHKEHDLYAMIIVEKMEIPLESLKDIAYQNARSAAPDLEIIRQEYRTVNGMKTIFMHMVGTMNGIRFAYYGHYFSNPQAAVQFITFTSQNLMKEYAKEAEEILAGMEGKK